MEFMHEVTFRQLRRRIIRLHRTGTPASCALCGADSELISIGAVARCAGVRPEELLADLTSRAGCTSAPFSLNSFICLSCFYDRL